MFFQVTAESIQVECVWAFGMASPALIKASVGKSLPHMFPHEFDGARENLPKTAGQTGKRALW